ncbi:hypothetical protein J1C56_00685 [Aminobacter anthyllidis]|uniref:Lipoprotein n=1 Tax=Aminobacter anthyllidis TaxID=1035067 RepID=A0A9X1A5W8_9HYPH|nr:hypothetical protein [Aminobacter anthyllidis]MBT1154101.1 hypothetical protein [Aminobacter anthyllidis]MDH4985320.1 hypothetical protein [Aminobacter anthyllidis]
MNRYYFLLVASLLIAGCSTDSGSSVPAGAAAPMMDQSVPQVARNACLREVARTTNTQQGVILDMLYSEANSQVTIGVGPERARWQCTVSNSGVVANVMSLTDEGKL